MLTIEYQNEAEHQQTTIGKEMSSINFIRMRAWGFGKNQVKKIENHCVKLL